MMDFLIIMIVFFRAIKSLNKLEQMVLYYNLAAVRSLGTHTILQEK